MKISLRTNILLFTVLALASVCVWYLVDKLLSDEMVIIQGTKYLNHDQVENILNRWSDPSWYLLKPIMRFMWVGVKVSFISAMLHSTFNHFHEIKINYREIFHAVLIGQFVFLVPELAKVCWFTFIKNDYDIADLYTFPTSFPTDLLIRKIQDPYSGVLWPFRVFNFVELSFCLIVAGNLGVRSSFLSISSKVLISYTILLFIISVFLSFIKALSL